MARALRWRCEYCSFSKLQESREEKVGVPYHIINYNERDTKRYKCPSCGITQWNISENLLFRDRLRLWLKARKLRLLELVGLKQWYVERIK